MRVYQREGSPHWWVDGFVSVSGTRKRVRKPTGVPAKRSNKADAQRAGLSLLKEAEEALRADLAGANAAKDPTLKAVLEAYRDTLEARGASSAMDVRSILRTVFGPTQGQFAPSLKVADLTTTHLHDFVKWRQGAGRSPGGIRTTLARIKAAIRLAEDLGVISPVRLKWPTQRVEQKTRHLTQAEWRAVWDALDPDREVVSENWTRTPSERERRYRLDARDLLVALTLSGGRLNEITSLTADAITPQGVLKIWSAKTGKERGVPIPPQLREVLTRRAAAAKAARTPYLFPGEGDRGHITECWVLRDAMDRAGLNAPHLVARYGSASLHTLRHTYASWLAQSGTILSELRDLLGHSTTAMTERYAHLVPSATMDRANGILSTALPDLTDVAQSHGTASNHLSQND